MIDCPSCYPIKITSPCVKCGYQEESILIIKIYVFYFLLFYNSKNRGKGRWNNVLCMARGCFSPVASARCCQSGPYEPWCTDAPSWGVAMALSMVLRMTAGLIWHIKLQHRCWSIDDELLWYASIILQFWVFVLCKSEMVPHFRQFMSLSRSPFFP